MVPKYSNPIKGEAVYTKNMKQMKDPIVDRSIAT